MKKIITIMLSVAILFTYITVAGAQQNESTEFTAKVTFPEVVYYDSNATEDTENLIYVPVSVEKKIQQFKSADITINYNPDVLGIDTVIVDEDTVYTKSFIEKEGSFTLRAVYNVIDHDETHAAELNFTASATIVFRIKSTGNMGINVSASITDFQNNKLSIATQVNDFYPDVADISDIEFLGVNHALNYVGDSRFILTRPVTVSCLRRYFSAYITVIDSNGNTVGEHDYVPTSSRVVAKYKGFITDEQLITVKGDVNCDGKVNAADARKVLRFSAKLEKPSDWIIHEAATFDTNNTISAGDARKILRMSAGTEKYEPSTIYLYEGDEETVGPLKNAGSGSYNWVCTIKEESGLSVTDTITPPLYAEINPGTPFEQYFTFKAEKAGTYNVHFELLQPWSNDIADSFDVVFVVI